MSQNITLNGVEYAPVIKCGLKLEESTMRVEPEYVDGITVLEYQDIQYFTWDAAIIHAKRLGKVIPTLRQFEDMTKDISASVLILELLPLGYRNWENCKMSGFGHMACYWTSTAPEGVAALAHDFSLSDSASKPSFYSSNRLFAMPIRCLKLNDK